MPGEGEHIERCPLDRHTEVQELPIDGDDQAGDFFTKTYTPKGTLPPLCNPGSPEHTVHASEAAEPDLDGNAYWKF